MGAIMSELERTELQQRVRDFFNSEEHEDNKAFLKKTDAIMAAVSEGTNRRSFKDLEATIERQGQHIVKLVEENARLKAQVKAAYAEGFREGLGIAWELSDLDFCWNDSDARKGISDDCTDGDKGD